MTRKIKLSTARRREDEVMRLLARIAYGETDAMPQDDENALRQLGYAASLVQGYLDDPENNLGAAIRMAADSLDGKTPGTSGFSDPVQAKWGAPWHLDAAKLRLETPLYLVELRRAHGKS